MVPVMVYLLLMLSSASAESTRNITLPGCPASCGNISIPYPFGIKPGCFRSSGFQLTCSTNRKLFLGDHNGSVEVTEIDIRGNQVSVNAPIFTMPADADSSITHWTPPRRGPYTVSNGNTFNVVGCGISAYMVDSETGEVTGMCLSVCGSSNHSSVFVGSGPSSSGNGYCSVSIINSAISYEIRLDRLRGEGEGDVRASGKAFLTSEGYSFMEQDLITPNLIGGSSVVPLTLDWVIRDRSTCMTLEKRNIYTYACRSNNSFCVDGNGGGYYTCQCSSWLQTTSTLLPLDGNPYVSGGCPDVVFNKELCSAPCGNISVPYPFGLGIECARDETFLLRCNASTHMLFLGNLKYKVTKIMVEEGQLLAEVLGESSTDESIEFDHLTGSRPTIVFDWVVDYMPCAEALKNNKSNFAL